MVLKAGCAMREIKFRGRVKNTNDPKWVYGIVIPPRYSSWEEWTLFDGERRWIVDPKTVGQYTGMMDSEENEIYEGDIITFPYRRRTETGVVKFDRSMYLVKNKVQLHKNLLFSVMFYKEIHVIGNIYDNPELFKDGEEE